MSKTLNIEVRPHFGTLHFYPKCQEGEFLKSLTGGSSIPRANLVKARSNGYELNYVWHGEEQLP